MATKRNSNIELLRIFAMIMIIAYHIYIHCVYTQLTDANSIDQLKNGLFNTPGFSRKLLILTTISPMGQVGNTIFIVISGYFMVSRGTHLNLAKISKKLLLQQGFAAIVLTLGSTLFMFVVRGKFVNLITINIFNGMSWYVGYYFGIIVLASVFLNEFLSELDRNQYIKFLLVIFAVTQFSWIGGVLNSLAGGLLTYSIGIFLYALGGYIQRYNPYKKIKSITIIGIILAVYIVIYISEYNLIENKIQMYQGGPFFQEIIGFNTNYLVPIVIGILLFELFIRIPIFFNGVANFIGASTLMIYLLHDNSFFYSIWNTQDWITILYYHPFRYILKHILWTAGTFLSGVLVYWIYTIIEKKIISVTDHRSETTGGDENGQI